MTALLTSLAFVRPASAQAVIDGGASETVPGSHASPWTVGGQLTVGDADVGSLSIGAGGIVSSTSSIIGNQAGSSGTVDLIGAPPIDIASWGAGSSLLIGNFGHGTMSLSLGVVTGNTASVGVEITGRGEVSLSNSSAWNNAGLVTIGVAGRGEVTVDGGSAFGSGGLILGQNGTGILTLDGASQWTGTTGTTVIGLDGTGTLTVGGGSSAYLDATSIGERSTGTVTVTGAGSLLQTGVTAIGNGVTGWGDLSVLQSATMTSTRATLGATAGSSAFVKVDGAGSSWTVTNELTVGDAGGANLTISGGATVHAGFALIGAGSGLGSVNVFGPNSLLQSDFALAVGVGIGGAGTGSLDIADGGRVVSSGDMVIGVDNGARGAVDVHGASSSLSITTGDLFIGGDGATTAQGRLFIWDGAVVTVMGGTGTVQVAQNAGSVGVLTIGGQEFWPGYQPPAAPGTLNASVVNLASTSATLEFNHTSTNYTFAPAIDGPGLIKHMAGTTILTADSSNFTGTTTITGGTLVVNGALGGLTDVLSGGRLQGSGMIGSVDIGGTIAPGNSIGTLNTGSITFFNGAVYEVEVNNAGQSDRIAVTGTATINAGSTVSVIAGAGNYAPLTQYTIITTTGGRIGTFDSVTSNLAFLTPSLSYDPLNVYLTLTRNGTAFGGIGITPNQIAAAGGVESLGGGAVYTAVLNLSADQARAAFDRLSGEIHASAVSALIEDSRFLRSAANDRVRAAFDSVGAPAMAAMAYAGGAAVPATSDRLVSWGVAFGSWGRTRSDGNAATLSRSTGGFLLGADGPVFERWRIGIMGGYSRTHFEAKDRVSSGNSDNYHAGLYGGTEWGDVAFRTGAAYTWHRISTSRSVSFSGFTDSLSGGYDASTAQAFGELGYGLRFGKAAYEPFVNLAYVNFRSDGFTENGGAAALTSASATTDTTFTTFGLRAATDFMLGNKLATARGMLGWRHAFGATTPMNTFSFAGSSSFAISGVPIARDAAVIEAGFDVSLSRAAQFGVTYGGQFSNSFFDQTLKADLTVRF
ncbi:MAG TPA: autotransporter domain-containing protein [Pseudolabrys sp.]|nr:autotransporter domain-containing protein [Pseudolabrys sp.]